MCELDKETQCFFCPRMVKKKKHILKEYSVFFQTYGAGGKGMFLKVSLFFEPEASQHRDISFIINHGVLLHLSKVKVKVTYCFIHKNKQK